jgi:hypothetical protein
MTGGVVRRGRRSSGTRDLTGGPVEAGPASTLVPTRDPLGAIGEALTALGFPPVEVGPDFDVARACAISAMLSADGYLRLAEEALRADPRPAGRLGQADEIRDLRDAIGELRKNIEPRRRS